MTSVSRSRAAPVSRSLPRTSVQFSNGRGQPAGRSSLVPRKHQVLEKRIEKRWIRESLSISPCLTGHESGYEKGVDISAGEKVGLLVSKTLNDLHRRDHAGLCSHQRDWRHHLAQFALLMCPSASVGQGGFLNGKNAARRVAGMGKSICKLP